MALQNPQGLYKQDIYQMNFQPYVNSILQARAKKAAREDAMGKYYMELPSKINDLGVRDDDRPVIEELRNKMYSFGLQNKDALRKGDGAAQLGMEKYFRQLNDVINTSKNLGKRALARVDIYKNPQTNWVLKNNDYMNAEHKEAQPIKIGDDGEVIRPEQMDMATLLSKKPFDTNKHIKSLNTFVTFTQQENRVADPDNPGMDKISYTPTLVEKDKERLKTYSAEMVNNDPAYAELIQSKIADPNELAKLNEVSKATFNHPIRTGYELEDAAAAYDSSLLINKPKSEKSQENLMGKRKNARDMQEDRQSHAIYMEGLKNDNIVARGSVNSDFVGGTGNSLDEIGGVRDVANKNGKRISKGIAYNPDGSAMTGVLTIAAEDLPSNVTTSLAAGKLPKQRYYKLFARNGIIESITTQNGEVTRVGMENLQKQADTEPAKKPAKIFGRNKPKEDLDPAGFKKEGKYWKYKDGRLFDDAGNVIKK